MRSLTSLLVAAALAGPAVAGAATAPTAPLPWIEDDYAKAVAEAKSRKVPIFLEAWAPW
jgi:hypothetical protein